MYSIKFVANEIRILASQKKVKKFVKVSLHFDEAVQISLQFDGIFRNNFVRIFKIFFHLELARKPGILGAKIQIFIT